MQMAREGKGGTGQRGAVCLADKMKMESEGRKNEAESKAACVAHSIKGEQKREDTLLGELEWFKLTSDVSKGLWTS